MIRATIRGRIARARIARAQLLGLLGLLGLTPLGCSDDRGGGEADTGGQATDVVLADVAALEPHGKLVRTSSPRVRGLEPIGVYTAPSTGFHTTEIVTFDPASARLFVSNATGASVDVVDLAEPRAPELLARIDVSRYGASPTSVDVSDGLLAIAIAADPAQDPGTVVLVRAADLEVLARLQVAALPDMLSFSPDGRKLVVACEGEPSDDYRVDPPGVIAIVDLGERGDAAGRALAARVRYAGFDGFDRRTVDPRIHIAGPGSSVAQDLEPEYVAISADSRTAWVSLQENSALAVVDLEHAAVTELVALPPARHPRLALHPELAGLPVLAMRQPDGVASFARNGREYVVSANEGDCRHTSAHAELSAAHELPLDPEAFPEPAALRRDGLLGRLAVSRAIGDLDGDGDYDQLYTCGSNSVSIWTPSGELVWDSGALFDGLRTDTRADAPVEVGPSPEGVVTATLEGRAYAFVGFERSGGIAVLDVSQPADAQLVVYEDSTGDRGPEGLEFIAGSDSPVGEPLLVVANELSHTVRIYRVVVE